MEKSSNATDDILEFIIVPYCPLDFLGVSKKWRTVAKQHEVRDLRLNKNLVQNAIVSACKFGNLATVKAYLTHKTASPTTNDLEALCTAIYYHKNEVAKHILETYKVDPNRRHMPTKKRSELRSMRYGSPIETAITSHNREMIDFFCAQKSHPTWAGYVFLSAIHHDKNLANDMLDCKDKFNLQMDGSFLAAAIHDRPLFERLLKFPEMTLDAAWSYIQSYHYNVSESWPFMLLLDDPRFELTDEAIKFCMGKCKDVEDFKKIMAKKGNDIHPTAEILDRAIDENNLPFVQFLLETPGWAKSTQRGFSTAAYRGRLDIIELLLAHGVQNENNCKEALSSLAYSGQHPEIIAKLMTLVTDFRIHDNAMQALDSKNDDVALVFLQHPKADLATQDQIYLRRACEHGLPKTVKFLLGQQKVNPTVQDSVTLRSAALNGHVEVVKLLMEDGRVDPAAKANHAIQCAALGDKIEIVQMLLADERVNPSVNNNYAYMKAKSQAVKDLLKKDDRVASKLPK